MTRNPAVLVRLLLIISAALLGFGLTLPCMTVVPNFGPYEDWVRLLDPSLTHASHYSVVSGIGSMFEQGAVGIGALLLGFSVIFPGVKIAIMVAAVEALRRREGPGWLMRLVHHAGKFSMLDVWVIAVLVVAAKGLPGDTEVRLGPGIYLFAGSVLCSVLSGAVMHHAEHKLLVGQVVKS